MTMHNTNKLIQKLVSVHMLKIIVLYEGTIIYIVQRSKAKINSQGGFDHNVM